MTLDTIGSSFDTLLASYTGTAVNALTAISGGSNDDGSGIGQASRVSFAVTAGRTYQFAVDGYNGAAGNYTLHLNFTAAPSGPPAAPNGLTASDGTVIGRVRVTWLASGGATSYEIWRSTSNDSRSATRITTTTNLTYDDTSASRGRLYYYWVRAVNSAGTSGFSASNSGYRFI